MVMRDAGGCDASCIFTMGAEQMSELDARYSSALGALARVVGEYHEQSDGSRAWLVGGAAVVIYTQGSFHSADYDIVAVGDDLLAEIFERHGFRKEDRKGHLHRGWYHPDHPGFGWEIVGTTLYDGHSDVTRETRLKFEPDGEIVLPPIEDVIADRLAQYAGNPTHDELLHQARALKLLAPELDMEYLNKRVAAEGGDVALLVWPEPSVESEP